MEFHTDFLNGFIIEGWDDQFDGCFGIEMADRLAGDENYTFGEFWTDTIRDVPSGAVYHEGFLIVHNQADGLALMARLEREYDVAVSEPKVQFVENVGWC